ncbi:MAG: hypothetical protein QXN55_07290 [Candidatus Nitrosotenuis sp.]
MANWSITELTDEILEQMQVKAAGQAARAEDANKVSRAIAASIDYLRGINLAPFEYNSIPEWATSALRDYVIADIGPAFGITGYSKKLAKEELRAQCGRYGPPIRVKAKYY